MRNRILFVFVVLVFCLSGEGRSLSLTDVPYHFAKEVAGRYAGSKWEGCLVGEGQLYYSPRGVPEVYFFLVYKDPATTKSVQAIEEEVAAARVLRVEMESAADTSSQMASVLDLWRAVSAPGVYGTIVIGAHRGREPFVASYSGLPPHILLKADAIETRRAQIADRDPGQMRYVWQPPMFVCFEFEADGPEQDRVFLRVVSGRFVRTSSVAECHALSLDTNNDYFEQRKHKWAYLVESLSAGTAFPAASEQGAISGVPDYQQDDFDYPGRRCPGGTGEGDCGPTAAACVLGYWDANGYPNLIDGENSFSSNPVGVTELVDSLKDNIDYPISCDTGYVYTDRIDNGIRDTAEERGYSFSAQNFTSFSWDDIKHEISVGRPFVYSIQEPCAEYEKHATTGVGYIENSSVISEDSLEASADTFVDAHSPSTNYGNETTILILQREQSSRKRDSDVDNFL